MYGDQEVPKMWAMYKEVADYYVEGVSGNGRTKG